MMPEGPKNKSHAGTALTFLPTLRFTSQTNNTGNKKVRHKAVRSAYWLKYLLIARFCLKLASFFATALYFTRACDFTAMNCFFGYINCERYDQTMKVLS